MRPHIYMWRRILSTSASGGRAVGGGQAVHNWFPDDNSKSVAPILTKLRTLMYKVKTKDAFDFRRIPPTFTPPGGRFSFRVHNWFPDDNSRSDALILTKLCTLVYKVKTKDDFRRIPPTFTPPGGRFSFRVCNWFPDEYSRINALILTKLCTFMYNGKMKDPFNFWFSCS